MEVCFTSNRKRYQEFSRDLWPDNSWEKITIPFEFILKSPLALIKRPLNYNQIQDRLYLWFIYDVSLNFKLKCGAFIKLFTEVEFLIRSYCLFASHHVSRKAGQIQRQCPLFSISNIHKRISWNNSFRAKQWLINSRGKFKLAAITIAKFTR